MAAFFLNLKSMGWHIGDNHRRNVETRQKARTERTALRQETKAVAYEHGIDPNQAMWQGISDVAKSAADVVGDVYGAKTGASDDAKSTDQTKGMKMDVSQTGQQTEAPKSNVMIYGVVVVVGFLLFMMLKKK